MNRHLQYLDAMGIQAWQLRDAAGATHAVPAPDVPEAQTGESAPPVLPGVEVATTGDAPTPDQAPRRPDAAGMDWQALESAVGQCTLCELHRSRTHTVFGTGNRKADWLVIGEAPGKDEDEQGEPFVGRAGQLLNAMLQALGLKREQVYIANILKCRPPNNRDPKPEEVVCCEPYLMRQITLLQPGIILAVGRIAAQNLLKTQTPIGKLRGQVHRLGDTDIPVIATYHPAYLLRSPLEKRKAWADLQLAMTTLKGAAQ